MAAAEAAAEGPEVAFPRGCSVTVADLNSQPEHNGADGVVLQVVSKTGRRKVKLLDCGRVLGVRPANLRLRAARATAAELALCSASAAKTAKAQADKPAAQQPEAGGGGASVVPPAIGSDVSSAIQLIGEVRRACLTLCVRCIECVCGGK